MTLRPAAHPRLILAALAFCGVLVSISQTIVVPLLPELPQITGSPAADVRWLMTVTLLTGAVATPLLGPQWGRLCAPDPYAEAVAVRISCTN